jgi:uncharacterized membrane protein YcaP (DUF421 family)
MTMTGMLIAIFGVKDHLDIAQECARAVLIFCYGLVMLRLSGRRTFGHWSALDVVMSIIAGSALSRAMTGGAPLPGTLAAVAVLSLLHLLVAYGVAGSKTLSRIIEGAPVTLTRDGVLSRKLRLWHAISDTDIGEAMRRHQLEGLEEMGEVREMTLEVNGRLSILKKK